MKPGRIAHRVLALLLSVSLAFPPSALALREQQEEDPTQRARLKAALTSGNPDAFVREAASTLAQPFVATPAPVAPAAGLEGPPVLVPEGAAFLVEKAGVIRGDAKTPLLRLSNGAQLVAEAGSSRIELAEGVRLESNTVLVAGQGHTIQVGPDTRIFTGAQIWGDAFLGARVEFAGTIDATRPGTETVIGDGTRVARGSTTAFRGAVLLPITMRTGQEGRVTEQQIPVNVNYATSILNSVVWGSTLFQPDFDSWGILSTERKGGLCRQGLF